MSINVVNRVLVEVLWGRVRRMWRNRQFDNGCLLGKIVKQSVRGATSYKEYQHWINGNSQIFENRSLLFELDPYSSSF